MSRGLQEKPVSRAVIESCKNATETYVTNCEARATEKKKEFIDHFLEFNTVKKTCQVIDIHPTTIANWCLDDPEFCEAVDRLKKIRDFVREEDEEEFLHLAGTGQVKMGKESGLGMPNVVAAKMGLVARNPKRWSERINVDRNITRTIKLITVHADQTETTVIEGECKELPVGNND